MKRIAIGMIIILALIGLTAAAYFFIIAPSFVGKTGPDGGSLKKYIDPAELKKLTEKPDDAIWIIDVRPAAVYAQGHIPTARSFPSSQIESRLAELPKEKYLIIYCETGGRVQAVIKKLEKHGYTRYMNWGASYRWKYGWATGNQ